MLIQLGVKSPETRVDELYTQSMSALREGQSWAVSLGEPVRPVSARRRPLNRPCCCTHLKTVMYADKGRTHIPGDLFFDESGEARERLELERHNVEKWCCKDVLSLDVGYRHLVTHRGFAPCS